MSRVDSSHSKSGGPASLNQEEICIKRRRSEERDRHFVRRALRRGVTPLDIEDRLLRTTEFSRLSPEHDPIAYVRGIVDEEASALGNTNPIDATAAHSSATLDNSGANKKGLRDSEAAAQRYIQENFDPTDWLAVVVRNRETGETVQRIARAQQIASHEFQSWLRHKNARGFDIYLSLNILKEHARTRTKVDVKEIRHLYLDLDEDGRRKLAAIYEDPDVPHPNYVLETSPQKYQVIWRVEGVAKNDAEGLLRSLARRFGGDRAATDVTRVFRIPGFNNKKYEPHFSVKVAAGTLPEQMYRQTDFRIEPISPDSETIPRTNVPNTSTVSQESPNTQSERDWAFAVRHLRQGDSPENIVREIAAYRSRDHYESPDTSILVSSRKPNPRYYAEHTVSRAMAHLGMKQSRKESTSPEIEPDR